MDIKDYRDITTSNSAHREESRTLLNMGLSSRHDQLGLQVLMGAAQVVVNGVISRS